MLHLIFNKILRLIIDEWNKFNCRS